MGKARIGYLLARVAFIGLVEEIQSLPHFDIPLIVSQTTQCILVEARRDLGGARSGDVLDVLDVSDLVPYLRS